MASDTSNHQTHGVRQHRAPRPASTSGGSGFWVVGAVLVLLMLSSSVPSALYVLYQERWDLSSGMITVVFAVYAVTVLIGLLVFGSLSDTVGRRPVLTAGLVLAIVSMLLFAGAQGLAWLLAARAVQGFAVGLATGAMGAALLELAPRSRPALGAQVNSAGPTIGIGLGGIGAGALVQYAPAPTALSYLLLVGAFALSLVGVFRMGESAPGAGGPLRVAPHRIRVPAEVRGRFAVLVLTIVAVWSVGGFYLSLGPHLALSLIKSANYLVGGATVALLAGAATGAQLLLGRVAALRTAIVGLLLLLAGLGLVLLSLAAGSAALFLVATAVLGSGWGAAFLGAFRALSALADPARRGELTAAVYVFAYLAMSVPAVLAGVLTNVHGLHRTSVGFMAAVAAVCVVALLATVRLGARGTTTRTAEGGAT
ncbi:MFS transporter [Streptomyces sp. NPDC093225]|uniref:MFS transporter n=1 Tax=Streptomyces sp. NPDC093225 TaxID=3366034 RepID=UPI00381A55F6